jgi:hypothetical protein
MDRRNKLDVTRGIASSKPAVALLRPLLLGALMALGACAGTPSGQTAGLARVSAPGPGLSLASGSAGAGASLASADQIVGLSSSEVSGLFGTPSLARQEAPAEIWQYAEGSCVLLVFLYQNAPGDIRVRHAETRTAGAPAQCLSRLQGRGAATTASRS